MSKIRATRSITLGRGRPGRRAQRGAALLILLAALMMGVLYGLFSSLNEAAATAPMQRRQQNAEALRQAKEALITWAATHVNKPGTLPCPDFDNDGVLNQNFALCNAPSTTNPAPVGRLPWRSLGLPDLRDATGERLWYAVANPLRHIAANAVNSDTQGDLTAEGATNAADVVAVVFAPGTILAGQDRLAGPNAAANYLEAINPYVANRFLAAPRCEQADCSLPYSGGPPVNGAINDQLILITHEDLFRAVEEEVRLRLNREIELQLSDYWTKWRTVLGLGPGPIVMPFAAPFIDATATPTDPTRPQGWYRGGGTAGQTVGLLPLTRDASFLTWDAVTVQTCAPPPCNTGWTPAPLSATPPNPDTTGDLIARVDHDGTDRRYQVTALLRNVGSTFALPIAAPAAPPPFSAPILTQSFDASGNLNVTYTVTVTSNSVAPLPLSVPKPLFSTVTLAAGGGNPDPGSVTRLGGTVSVLLPAPHGLAVDDRIRVEGASQPDYNGVWTVTAVPNLNTFQFNIGAATPASPATGGIRVSPAQAWLFENKWYQHLLYAVSPGVVPGTGFTGTCVALVSCVRVESARPADARADARFALVLAGRHILPTTRNPALMTDYFEGRNATAGAPPAILERTLRGPGFNDKVVAK